MISPRWFHWWTHSTLASFLVPVSAPLWRRRLHLQGDPHSAEMAAVRRALDRSRARMEQQGILGAVQKASEAQRHAW